MVEEFESHALRIAGYAEEKQALLEHFKKYFCRGLGRQYYPSTDASWAETDLSNLMADLAENPPLFIEAFMDACEELSGTSVSPGVPSEDDVNAILDEHDIGYRLDSGRLELTRERPRVWERPDPDFEGANPVWVLISSPGDLAEERQRAISVCKRLSERLGVPIRPLLWEGGQGEHDDVPPIPARITGDPPQEVIDQYVVDELGGFDIYVGLIWSRMGTPIAGCRSGTEAEFELAKQEQEDQGRPSTIIFLEKQADYPRRVEPSQLEQVREFVSELQEQGLIQRFDDAEDFETVLEHHLKGAVREALEARGEAPRGACFACGSRRVEVESRVEPDTIEDDGTVSGVIELIEIYCNECGWSVEYPNR